MIDAFNRFEGSKQKDKNLAEDIKFISKKLNPIDFNKVASGEIKTGNELLLSLGHKANCH